jgi:hypothetical protein
MLTKEISEVEKGCGNEFQMEIETSDKIRKLFLFQCGKWREIEKLNNHMHMDWCPVCQAKLSTLKSCQAKFDKLKDQIDKIFIEGRKKGRGVGDIWDLIQNLFDELSSKQEETC